MWGADDVRRVNVSSSAVDGWFTNTSGAIYHRGIAVDGSRLDADGCDTEVETLSSCMGGFVSLSNPKSRCEIASDKLLAKYDECNLAVRSSTLDEEQEWTEKMAEEAEC